MFASRLNKKYKTVRNILDQQNLHTIMYIQNLDRSTFIPLGVIDHAGDGIFV